VQDSQPSRLLPLISSFLQPGLAVHVVELHPGLPSQWMQNDADVAFSTTKLLQPGSPTQRMAQFEVPQLMVMFSHASWPVHETRQAPASPQLMVPMQSFLNGHDTLHRATPGGQVTAPPSPPTLHPPSQPPVHPAGQTTATSAGASTAESAGAPSGPPSVMPPLLLLPLEELAAPLDELVPAS
jgi:hypothetical protein